MNPDHLKQLEELTREYARFSQTAAGLGSVLGGVLAMIMWTTSNLVSLPLWARLLMALFPIAWILVKEYLRRHYYQRHGLVREVWDQSQRRWHIFFTAFIALVSTVIVGAFVYLLGTGATLNWQLLAYLAFVVSMPFFVWFYMRSTEEFLVGVLLFVQAAVIIAGGHYGWWNIHFALFALFAIGVGGRQHLAYRKLNRKLQALRRQS